MAQHKDQARPLTKASDFPPEVLSLFDKYVHSVIDRRGFLEGAAKFAVGGVTAAGLLDALNPRFAEAAAGPQGRPAHQGRVRRVPLAAGLRQGARLSGAGHAGKGRRASSRRAGRAREPRAQPAHRGRRAAPRARGLHGLRARRALPARRLSRRRGQGARAVRQAGPGQDARGLRRRGAASLQGAPRMQRQARRRSASATAAASPTCWRRACPT